MLPVYPANPTPEALALYAAEMDRYRAESARLHAQAQADTAAAMQSSVDALPQEDAYAALRAEARAASLLYSQAMR